MTGAKNNPCYDQYLGTMYRYNSMGWLQFINIRLHHHHHHHLCYKSSYEFVTPNLAKAGTGKMWDHALHNLSPVLSEVVGGLLLQFTLSLCQWWILPQCLISVWALVVLVLLLVMNTSSAPHLSVMAYANTTNSNTIIGMNMSSSPHLNVGSSYAISTTIISIISDEYFFSTPQWGTADWN